MKRSDFKYLLAYLTPLTGWISLSFDGLWSYTTVFFVFVLVPIVDQIAAQSTMNLSLEDEKVKSKSKFFDFLLYLNFPILFALLFYYFLTINEAFISIPDLIGKTLSIGVIIGGLGINVAHEIGHRKGTWNQIISQFMLLPALYMHFNIEHNRGHHKRVATLEDPATSRFGETFYHFWFRSVFKGYLSAWEIANDDLRKAGLPVLSIQNKMIQFTIIQIIFILAVLVLFNVMTVFFFIVSAIIGFTQLEIVNYIEHYGLLRTRLASGKYAPVASTHSWNSNHEFGRILLYELTRHSDHHYKSTRKFQILRHFEDSPQLPYGYPASMLMAIAPPLWFKVMDPTLKQYLTRKAV